ncbi:hypothetical protein MW368_000342 [Acinetobacter baumannii]|nr:hypothetical protein [Acinetobacter baumannii]
MDNYKIKVNDEAESKEAQELFFELGYEWRDSKRDITNLDVVFIYAKDGVLTAGFNDHNFAEAGHKELTLPQLRDLVVLKRNDVKDATHVDQYGDKWLYLDERHYVYLNDQWDLPIGEFLERYELKPILPVKNQDPALFSIDDVWKAFWKNQKVQYSFDDDNHWQDDIESLKIEDIKSGHYQFRLKPQTIKLELEIPAPFQPKEGEECCYISDESIDGYHTVSYNSERYSGMIFGLYRPSDIEKVVALFRSAFGGAS